MKTENTLDHDEIKVKSENGFCLQILVLSDAVTLALYYPPLNHNPPEGLELKLFVFLETLHFGSLPTL